MDDNLADYRRFCASRLKRLERCKKTKSFCNLDDEIPCPFASSDSNLVLRGLGTFASCNDSIAFSKCSGNIMVASAKSERVPFCSRTSISCSESKIPPVIINTPRFESTGISSINVMSSIAEASPRKLSLATKSCLENNQKSTLISAGNSNLHLPLFSCSSPHSSSTTASSTISSQPTILSTINPESETRTTITVVNDSNDCGDSNQRAQRNFDLLREKMISLMENDVRLLQQLLALGDSIQELKSRSQVHGYSRLSLYSLEKENDDDEKWWSNDGIKTTFGSSLSAVTNLYVDDEPKENQNKQYFSRKNSVLRIPIPPKSSNRMSTNEKLHRRLSRLSQRCEQLHQYELVENSSQIEDGAISKNNLVPIMTVTCPLPQPKPFSSAALTMKQRFGTTDTCISSASIDSGIRDESCSSSSVGSLSPFLKEEKS